MKRLTKRLESGVAYLGITDKLPRDKHDIEGSREILEEIYKVVQKLADYEDAEEIK